jgi:hypothetical protein
MFLLRLDPAAQKLNQNTKTAQRKKLCIQRVYKIKSLNPKKKKKYCRAFEFRRCFL